MAEDPDFHYPPDVFEAVVTAIPVLVKGKQDVLTFFQACESTGPTSRHSNHGLAVRSTRASTPSPGRCWHLNEFGDGGLAGRRRLLQRVSEFENFASCWPGDVLRAEGAVAQLGELINKKEEVKADLYRLFGESDSHRRRKAASVDFRRHREL